MITSISCRPNKNIFENESKKLWKVGKNNCHSHEGFTIQIVSEHEIKKKLLNQNKIWKIWFKQKKNVKNWFRTKSYKDGGIASIPVCLAEKIVCILIHLIDVTAVLVFWVFLFF